MKKNLLLMIALLCAFIANAQTDDNNSLALQLVKKQQAAIGLSDEELNNVIVSNSYFNQTSGTQLVYLQQSYKGIPVYNQLHVLAFKNGQLVSKSGGRIKGIEKKTGNNNGIPMINAETAVISNGRRNWLHQGCRLFFRVKEWSFHHF